MCCILLQLHSSGVAAECTSGLHALSQLCAQTNTSKKASIVQLLHAHLGGTAATVSSHALDSVHSHLPSHVIVQCTFNVCQEQ